MCIRDRREREGEEEGERELVSGSLCEALESSCVLFLHHLEVVVCVLCIVCGWQLGTVAYDTKTHS